MTRKHCFVLGTVIGKERHLSVPLECRQHAPAGPSRHRVGSPWGFLVAPGPPPGSSLCCSQAVLPSRWAALFSGRDNTSRCSDGLKLCYSHFDFYKCCLLHLSAVFAIPDTLYYTLYSLYKAIKKN